MIELIAPAVIVALIGIIVQGIKAIGDIFDRYKTRKANVLHRKIALCVALMQLTDAMGYSEGDKLEIKKELANNFLSAMLSDKIQGMLQLK